MAKYTVVKVNDVLNYSQNGEMRMMGQALGSDQVALTYRNIPTGFKSTHGAYSL
jgi:hypothetical protein